MYLYRGYVYTKKWSDNLVPYTCTMDGSPAVHVSIFIPVCSGFGSILIVIGSAALIIDNDPLFDCSRVFIVLLAGCDALQL